MEGYFTFRYLEGIKKGQKFEALINPFFLQIDENTTLIENPLAQFFDGMHWSEFLKG